MSGHIKLSIADGIGRITIDRPEKRNAITPAMTLELREACRAVDATPDVRVVILAGAGEHAFSAGSDMNALAELDDAWAFRNRLEYAALVRDIRKPVIAALRGWVLGGGLEIALAADIRVAAKSARLGAPEVVRGWLGGGGASQMLPRLVGYGQAMRLLLTGDPVDATKALAIGLVEELVEDAALDRAVTDMARKIASFSPIAVEAVKAATRAALSMPLDAGLRYENEVHALCMQSKHRSEGISAFRQRPRG
jgi:enoyl-CoA hydratase